MWCKMEAESGLQLLPVSQVLVTILHYMQSSKVSEETQIGWNIYRLEELLLCLPMDGQTKSLGFENILKTILKPVEIPQNTLCEDPSLIFVLVVQRAVAVTGLSQLLVHSVLARSKWNCS